MFHHMKRSRYADFQFQSKQCERNVFYVGMAIGNGGNTIASGIVL